MSKVKNGDTVKLTMVGVWNNGLVSTGSSGCYFQFSTWETLPPGVMIEVIEPPFVLPTKLWAQVHDRDGVLWTRTYLNSPDLEEWNDLSGNVRSSRWLMHVGGLTVISEGIDA